MSSNATACTWCLAVLATLGSAACDRRALTDPATLPIRMDVVSGEAQQAGVGEELPDPLVVRVMDASGHPLKEQLVNFRVVSGGGSMYAGSSLTDKQGFAQDYWTMGLVPGPATAEVRAVDPTTGEKHSYATFTATATGGAAQHSLTVSVSGPGTVAVTTAFDNLSCSQGQSTCQFSIQDGLTATLTAIPDPATVGAVFDGWTGDCSGAGSCLVSMDADRTIGALFSVHAVSTSDQIRAVRDAPDGPADLAIDGALVTYVTPLGVGPRGFFVQAEAEGPALYIAVDPAGLVPEPVAGDRVSLIVTEMGTDAALREATAIPDLVIDSHGNSLVGLIQDIANTPDVVVNVPQYESELIHVTGHILGRFVPSGIDYVAAAFETPGYSGSGLQLRVRLALAQSLDLGADCTVTLSGVPLWRHDATAQVSAWMTADFTEIVCPAPSVIGASAPTSTSVEVVFDRLIDAASVLPDGSQFSIDGGLTVTAAVVSGNTVTLTTVSQNAGVNYTVIVTSSVTDTYGTGVDAGANSATFTGSGSS